MQGSYHVGNTASRPISEVKQRWALLVLAWETSLEPRVTLRFCQNRFFFLACPKNSKKSHLYFDFLTCRTPAWMMIIKISLHSAANSLVMTHSIPCNRTRSMLYCEHVHLYLQRCKAYQRSLSLSVCRVPQKVKLAVSLHQYADTAHPPLYCRLPALAARDSATKNFRPVCTLWCFLSSSRHKHSRTLSKTTLDAANRIQSESIGRR
jgi:hypothetical protein